MVCGSGFLLIMHFLYFFMLVFFFEFFLVVALVAISNIVLSNVPHLY